MKIELVHVFLVLVVGSILIVTMVLLQASPDPGVAWKVSYTAYPELHDIYRAFVSSCKTPSIPAQYFQDTQADPLFQSMRQDCLKLPNIDKYETYELSESRVHSFVAQNKAYRIPPSVEGQNYMVRYGCYRREITESVARLATENISKLMRRLGLKNRLERLTDSRGSTYMPAGGFMEYHSNQNHYGGWRLYMHYLPESSEKEGKSWFAYRHPFDGTYRRISDSNTSANMFRIRKPPKRLLWHAIFTDTPRFSWGIWIPPELAQHLKVWGTRV